MRTKAPRRPRDPNQLAKLMVDIATQQVEEAASSPDTPATEFARSGGLKGGLARAASLSPKRRQEIAAKAAKKRWDGKKKS
jgi:hypothetical protein